MYEFFIAVFLLLLLVVAAFLFWCAFQMTKKDRQDLAGLWVPGAPPEVDTLAPQFARRDLALGCACLLFVLLSLWQPQRFGWWLLALVLGFGAYYGYTRYAVLKLQAPAG